MARYRFTKPIATYRNGQVVDLDPRQAERLSGYVERVDPLDMLAKSPSTISENAELVGQYEAQLREAGTKLKSQAVRIAELEQIVADYSQGNDAPAETAELRNLRAANENLLRVIKQWEAKLEAAAARIAELEAGQVEEEVEAADVATLPEPEPAAEEPHVEGEPDAAWRSLPVAGLGIPSTLKGHLLRAGLTTAGEVADGLEDGTVLALDGIGEKKTAELASFLETIK